MFDDYDPAAYPHAIGVTIRKLLAGFGAVLPPAVAHRNIFASELVRCKQG